MKNFTNKRQKGFTLIELVIVIVILGILAATAAPKFIDLTGDARSAVMQGLEGALNSGTGGIHAKALMAGETGTTGTVEILGEHYNLAFGFPAADGLGAKDGTSSSAAYAVENTITISDSMEVTVTASGGVATFTKDGTPSGSVCTVTYTQPTTAGQVPVVTSNISGC